MIQDAWDHGRETKSRRIATPFQEKSQLNSADEEPPRLPTEPKGADSSRGTEFRASGKECFPFIPLASLLHQDDGERLRFACAQLISQGLLIDVGIGRVDTGSNQIVVPSEMAYWLRDWMRYGENL